MFPTFRACAVATLLVVTLSMGYAHCDGEDGPVVAAAKAALDSGTVEPALAWVQAKDEAEIRAAFTHVLTVRGLSPQAKELADHYFHETLVRVHRAGEGAGFDGLKPAGRDLGPAIPAADRAIASGSLAEVHGLLSTEIEAGLQARFHAVREAKEHKPADVAAGRRYVAAYVAFAHYVVGIHGAATGAGAAHEEGERPTPAAGAAHHHE